MSPNHEQTLEEEGTAWVYFSIMTYIRTDKALGRSSNGQSYLDGVSDIDHFIIQQLQD